MVTINELIQLTWIEACRKGSYLVSITESAALNIDEQLFKRKGYLQEIDLPMIESIFNNLHVTPGIIGFRLEKCKQLCTSFLLEYNDNPEKALKEYAYSLRNILLYSEYKDFIKELEKLNSQVKDYADFDLYVAKRLLEKKEPYHRFAQVKYMLLYSFVREVREASRATANLMKPKINVKQVYSDFFDFVQKDNRFDNILTTLGNLKQITVQQWADFKTDFLHVELTKRAWTKEQWLVYFYRKIILEEDCSKENVEQLTEQQIFPAGEMNALVFIEQIQYFETFGENTALLAAHHINIDEILQSYTVTFADLTHILVNYLMHLQSEQQQQFFEKVQGEIQLEFAIDMKKMVLTGISNLALMTYVNASTAKFQHIAEKKAMKQDQKKIQKSTAKPLINDSQLKKELLQLQQAVKETEEQKGKLFEQLQKLERQLADSEAQRFHLQRDNEELNELLALANDGPAVSDNAKRLVGDMHLLLEQLGQELALEPVAKPEESSYLAKIKSLKIAIIGGHQKYHAQLKQKFKKDVLMIAPDKLNFNTNQLTNYDVIVILTAYTNHSLYERTFDQLKKNQVKHRALILDSQPNAERLAKQIHAFYEQMGK